MNRRNSEIIALIGLSGAGKSSVGRALATRLGWELADTDVLIEQAAGYRIPQIFAERGEEVFRELESSALRQALTQPLRIVATGAGAILRPENRALLRQHAFVVWLDAPTTTLVDRLLAHDEQRPLLTTGDPAARLEMLRTIRAPLYAETADLSLSTTDLNLSQITTYILKASQL
jgi:shikimate kinase